MTTSSEHARDDARQLVVAIVAYQGVLADESEAFREVLALVPGAHVVTAGEALGTVAGPGGAQQVDATFDQLDRADVVVVPGGLGTHRHPEISAWLRRIRAAVRARQLDRLGAARRLRPAARAHRRHPLAGRSAARTARGHRVEGPAVRRRARTSRARAWPVRSTPPSSSPVASAGPRSCGRSATSCGADGPAARAGDRPSARRPRPRATRPPTALPAPGMVEVELEEHAPRR